MDQNHKIGTLQGPEFQFYQEDIETPHISPFYVKDGCIPLHMSMSFIKKLFRSSENKTIQKKSGSRNSLHSQSFDPFFKHNIHTQN